jgi:hypothetical protein
MSDPDPFAAARRQLEADVAAHATVRATKRYQEAQTHLRRLLTDFALTLQLSTIAFSRYPDARKWIQQANVDDLLETVVAIPLLVEQGIFNTARRELRYLLESLVKFVYVDQQLPGETPLQDRVAFLADQVPRSSIDPIDQLSLRLLSDPDAFRSAVRQAFGALSGYVHPSRTQIEERLRRAARGEFSGFEGPKVVEVFTRLASQTLDLAVVLICEGIGPNFTGDLYVQLFDDYPRWNFHRTKFAAQISAHFDYKLERQPAERGDTADTLRD